VNFKRLVTSSVVAVLIVAGTSTAVADPSPTASGEGGPKFDIALIGDLPYNELQELQELQTQNLFEELDREKLAFITHDGDIKSGSSACTNDVYKRELDRFESSRNSLFYTPGDNEWTDCHRPPNPSPEEADPLNRLELIRDTFFTTDESLGQKTIPLERQSEEYPENARWERGGITFATLHVVGSNNNRPAADRPSIGNEEEYQARNAANLEWLRGTFARARAENSPAVMLVIQANVFEGDNAEPSGFAEFKATLEEETARFKKPVVLVHGDSHTFRIDKPRIFERRLTNFTRVETFGSPDVHWVRAEVDTRDPEVFTFQPEIVEENVRTTAQ
jgi:hypothetical protein